MTVIPFCRPEPPRQSFEVILPLEDPRGLQRVVTSARSVLLASGLRFDPVESYELPVIDRGDVTALQDSYPWAYDAEEAVARLRHPGYFGSLGASYTAENASTVFHDKELGTTAEEAQYVIGAIYESAALDIYNDRLNRLYTRAKLGQCKAIGRVPLLRGVPETHVATASAAILEILTTQKPTITFGTLATK